MGEYIERTGKSLERTEGLVRGDKSLSGGAHNCWIYGRGSGSYKMNPSANCRK